MHLSAYRAGGPRTPGEGLRIGTVRYVPRGVRREDYARLDYFDVWFPLLAPSPGLIRWLKSKAKPTAAAWATFVRRYKQEMRRTDASQAIALLAELARQTPIAIGCYCENEARCHRSILRTLIAAHAERPGRRPRP